MTNDFEYISYDDDDHIATLEHKAAELDRLMASIPRGREPRWASVATPDPGYPDSAYAETPYDDDVSFPGDGYPEEGPADFAELAGTGPASTGPASRGRQHGAGQHGAGAVRTAADRGGHASGRSRAHRRGRRADRGADQPRTAAGPALPAAVGPGPLAAARGRGGQR